MQKCQEKVLQSERKPVIDAILKQIDAGDNLTAPAMAQVIENIMQGHWKEEQIAQLLTRLHAKGETAEEIVGAARALRKFMQPIQCNRKGLLDTCGTGGDGSQTFNISTAAALVAAAAGVPVAKHGNRGVTSKSGSANVLAELGVNIEAPLETVERCFREIGICFCFAPLWHPSMKRVAAVRQKLKTRTIFNLLGPLCNPAGAPFQLLGVGHAAHRPLLAEALRQLNEGNTISGRAMVVHGEDGLDELTLAGTTHVSEISNGTISEHCWTPEDFGLQTASLETLRVNGPTESAKVIHDILTGKLGPARDIVVLNAAAALLVAALHDSPQEAATAAANAIDTGAAKDTLERLIVETNKDA